MVRLVGLLRLSVLARFRYMNLRPLRSKSASNNPKFSLIPDADVIPPSFERASTCVKSFNRALLHRLFKDVSNYEIVKVLTPHFIVAKRAGGADLEWALQSSTRRDGHSSIHSQLRLGEKEGPQGFPLIPCHVCGRLLFSKVNQWFCSVFHSQFPLLLPFASDSGAPHLLFSLFGFYSGCRAERGKTWRS